MSARAGKALGHAATVFRLLRDVARLKGFSSLSWLGLLPGVSMFILDKRIDSGWLIAGSMAIACGASIGGERIFSREYRVLPVTDRDLWVTRCMRATCLVPAGLLLYKCGLMAMAARRGRSLFTLDTLLLSTVFDAVYAGAFLPVPLWLETEGRALARRLGSSAFLVSLTLLLFSVPVAMAMPFFVARSLPKHLNDFSTAGVLTLVVGLTMAVAALLWTPRKGGASAAVWVRATPDPVQATKPDNGKSLKGIPVVLWPHAKATFIAAFLAMLLAAAIAPFLPAKPEPPRFLTALVILFALMGTATGGVWAPWTRRLKVLPLSATAVNALLVTTPFFTWLVIWAAMVLVHVALQWPLNVELGPAAMLMYAGLSALTHAVVTPVRGIVLGQTVAAMLGVTIAAGIAVTLFDHPESPQRRLLLAVSVLSLVVAATINHYTLTRSTSSARAYRPLGVSMRP